MSDPNRNECNYSEKPNSSDTISRQTAIDAMDTWDKFGCNPDGRLVRFDDNKHYVPYVRYDDMVYVIKSLPSAQPERKKGSWNVIQGDIVVCSECGMGAPKSMTGCLVNRHLEPNRTNFCPNCGADMRETE